MDYILLETIDNKLFKVPSTFYTESMVLKEMVKYCQENKTDTVSILVPSGTLVLLLDFYLHSVGEEIWNTLDTVSQHSLIQGADYLELTGMFSKLNVWITNLLEDHKDVENYIHYPDDINVNENKSSLSWQFIFEKDVSK